MAAQKIQMSNHQEHELWHKSLPTLLCTQHKEHLFGQHQMMLQWQSGSSFHWQYHHLCRTLSPNEGHSRVTRKWLCVARNWYWTSLWEPAGVNSRLVNGQLLAISHRLKNWVNRHMQSKLFKAKHVFVEMKNRGACCVQAKITHAGGCITLLRKTQMATDKELGAVCRPYIVHMTENKTHGIRTKPEEARASPSPTEMVPSGVVAGAMLKLTELGPMRERALELRDANTHQHQ